jgi:ribosomal-protein-alanine N-acetyltransferase
MAYGWEGSKVRLVPADKEKHFENALRWINDPEITHWTLVGDFPIARLAEEEWFDNMSKRMDNTEVFFAIETLEGEHIGFSGIHRIDWRNGAGTTGTMIGAKEFWGQGYGSDAARTRTHYAFEVLGLRMLLSEVMADNTGSLTMLQRAGYREVGRIPKRYWRRGAYRDAVILAVQRDEWVRHHSHP